MISTELTINFPRLQKDLREISAIGMGKNRGVYRQAFTENDLQARNWLIEKISEAGLELKVDGAANIIARYASNETKRPSILIGSHIDSVPAAGTLDGTLGVLTGLEVLRSLKENNVQLEYPVELASFSDEEGRFGGLFGSQSFIGRVTPESIHNAKDLSGTTLIEAMENCGYDAMQALNARRTPESILCYLELHIEQGPVLDSLRIPLGVVSKISGLFKWKISLIGRADHAGTTPMNMRADALAGLSEFIVEIPRLLEENGNENSVMTVGKVELHPGVANSVPGRVEFSIDARSTEKDILHEMNEAARKTLSAIARRRKLMFEFQILSEVEPVDCDQEIISTIRESISEMNTEFHELPSGAAHDAQILAHITPVGMIFVPSKDGRSHSPAEWTDWDHMRLGAEALLKTVCKISEKNKNKLQENHYG